MTSVEWLIDQLVKMDKQLDGRRKNEDATILKMNPTKLFEQAIEMHKQEILDAYKKGRDEHYLDWYPQKHSEEYYQETFKKDH